ncbi:MAG: hypothetical protein ACK5WR_16260 [Planctomycetaceae bacterium]
MSWKRSSARRELPLAGVGASLLGPTDWAVARLAIDSHASSPIADRRTDKLPHIEEISFGREQVASLAQQASHEREFFR